MKLLFCAWVLKRCTYGLFEKGLDEWEEMSSWNQTWDKFQGHFLEAEERFQLKKKIHDKKGGIGQAHAVTEYYKDVQDEQHDFSYDKMDVYLDNLAAAATQEKNVLDQPVSNNTKLVAQLEALTNKFNELSNKGNGTSDSNVPMIYGKK